MVVTGDDSADGPMWRKLREKLRIVGRAVEGHTEGSARGVTPSLCLPSKALMFWTMTSLSPYFC